MNAEADGSFHAFPQHCGQVFALGLTYADHIRETAQSVGEPVVFMKCGQPEVEPNVLPTPGAAGLLERISRLDDQLARWLSARYAELPALLDYEVELGLLMLEDVSRLRAGCCACFG